MAKIFYSSELLRRLISSKFGSIEQYAEFKNTSKQNVYEKIRTQSNKFLKELLDDGILLESNPQLIANHEADTIAIAQTIQYPIAGSIPTGVAEINDLSENAEYEDAFFHPDDHFWLRIDEWYGDSMRPMIVPGDLVLCSYHQKVKNGDVCAVQYDKSKGAVKIWSERKDYISLISVNPVYEPIEIQKENIKKLYKVVMIKKSPKKLKISLAFISWRIMILKAAPKTKAPIYDDVRKANPSYNIPTDVSKTKYVHLVPQLPKWTNKEYRSQNEIQNLFNLSCSCSNFKR